MCGVIDEKLKKLRGVVTALHKAQLMHPSVKARLCASPTALRRPFLEYRSFSKLHTQDNFTNMGLERKSGIKQSTKYHDELLY